MQDGLYVALSSQIALEKRLNTIADNVANSSTVGFRATGVKFEDVVSGLGDKSLSFTSAGDTFISDINGPLRQTGNPFDFAIQGDAWFGIETPAGTVMTRDGRFTMTDTGQLVTIEGFPVLDAGGAPIQLDPRNGPPRAGADGSLAAERPACRRARPVTISIPGRTSSASEIPASFRPANPSRSSTGSKSAWRRAFSRNRTSTRCWR